MSYRNPKWTWVLVATLAACSNGRERPVDQEEPSSSVRLGEAIDASACTTDEDCPYEYACVSGTCRPASVDLDNDGFAAAIDCDDRNSTVNPGRAELCNGVDDNCNGVVDEGVRNACGACGPPPEEVCDYIDNDCDGYVDEDCVAGAVSETEPNDRENCQPITLPPDAGGVATISGAFDPGGDVDSFCFDAESGVNIEFDLDSAILGAPTDAALRLRDGAGASLAYNDFYNGVDPRITYAFTTRGRYRIDVYNLDPNSGGPFYVYELKVTSLVAVDCVDEDGDGFTTCAGDCRDDDASIFPDQREDCDGVDNDCNGAIDETCVLPDIAELEPNDTDTNCPFMTLPFNVSGAIQSIGDKDRYCFFAPAGAVVGFDVDAREPPLSSLLESALTIYRPGTIVSVASNYGNTADPQTGFMHDPYLKHTFQKTGFYSVDVRRNGGASSGNLRYRLEAVVHSFPACTDNDGDGVTVCEGDCNDANPDVYLGRPELCDNVDNDCDGYRDPAGCDDDADGDGVSLREGDCDDSQPHILPGAAEICDGVDNDCDGEVDDGVKNACGSCGFPPPEVCSDGVDNDCDGVVDEADCGTDADGDGFSPAQGDCNDDASDSAAASIYPGADELCDGLDNDCDGIIDEFMRNACGGCGPDPVELCDYLDNDCDGIVDEGVRNRCGDCAPDPVEVCDGQDNDCDGEIDEGVTNACGVCGPVPADVCDDLDNDCDGLTDPGCDVDTDGDGQTPRDGDCDPSNADVYWGAPEDPAVADTCSDGIDNDCDGFIDGPGCAAQAETEPNDVLSSCKTIRWPGVASGAIATVGDKDTFCITVGAAQLTPAGSGSPPLKLRFDIDAQVNGSTLNSFLELYRNGTRLATNDNTVLGGQLILDSAIEYEITTAGTYVVLVRSSSAAETTGAYTLEVKSVAGCLDNDRDGITSCAGDCDDYSAGVHPGATDRCDGADNDCDGLVDELCVADCLDDRYEHNDSTLAAATLVSNAGTDVSTAAAFCYGDFDYYAIATQGGEVLEIQTLFSAGALIDVALLDTDAYTVLGEFTTDDDLKVISVNVPPSSGYRYLRVAGPITVKSDYSIVVSFN